MIDPTWWTELPTFESFEENMDEGIKYLIKGKYRIASYFFVEAANINRDFIPEKFRKLNPYNSDALIFRFATLDSSTNYLFDQIELSLSNINNEDFILFNPFERDFILVPNLITAILKDYKIIINHCFNICVDFKSISRGYKLLGLVHVKLKEPYDTYNCYKKALYFDKNLDIQSDFYRLADEYGENDKVNEEKFDYKLITNIDFEYIYKEPLPSRRLKFDVNGEEVSVEKMVMNYYSKKGYKSDHCEGEVINFLSDVIFRDILFNKFKLDEEKFKNKINNRVSEFNEDNFYDLVQEYYISNKNVDSTDEYPYANYGYPGFDYIDYFGYDVWIKIIDNIGFEKCLEYVKELVLRDEGCLFPKVGMPDLIVFNNNEVFLAEVKSTNDKLSYEQMFQHMYLSEKLDVPIIIVTVNKDKKQINSIKKQYHI